MESCGKMMTGVPKVRLGGYIEECDERNSDLSITLSQGISNLKYFQDPKQVAENSKADKIVRNGQFAYNRATTRNGEKISIAYREGEDCTVSSAYGVFRITDEEQLNPHYLLMFFRRPDFDRFARWRSEGSAHEFFTFEMMRNVEIPLPDIEVQRDLVAIYAGLQKIMAENEALIAQLESVCHDFVVDCKSKYPKVKLGAYIEESREKNSDGKYNRVYGLSTLKKFREASVRVDRNELNNYKIVYNNYFAFVPTTDTWKVFACALNKGDTIVVSPIYCVFAITDPNLLPEYLSLIYRSNEFDRYVRFNSWGSARENFNYSDLCNVYIPLPPIDVQKSIVDIYCCLDSSKRIVADARELMKNLCPALIQKAAHSA